MRWCRRLWTAGIGLLLPLAASAAPAELGEVRWERSLERGLERSRETGKPVFLLFQEVPGCATCVGFGETVLSEPLFVEAIESEFVAVAIFNNKGGADAAALRRFDEPSWNNPVVRFVDGAGVDLLPRRDRIWTPVEMGPRMIAALRRAKRPVPEYLRIAVDQAKLRSSAIATFSMHCYWRGEVCLGGIDGVLSTRAGWLGGREVVEVRYDSRALSYEKLLAAVARAGCADGVFAHGDRQAGHAAAVFGDRVTRADGYARDASEPNRKYYLRRSPLAGLPLGATQAMRLNAALGGGKAPERWLSPRQLAAAGIRRVPVE